MSEHRKEIMLEDGRLAERVVREDVDCETRTGTRVTEVWANPKPPARKLSQRVVESLEPVVSRRELETYNEDTGELLSKEVEAVDSVKLQVVERLVSSCAVEPVKAESDCFVTREEMREDICEAMKMVVKTVKNGNGKHLGYTSKRGHVSMQETVEEKLEQKQESQVVNYVLWGLIAVMVAGLAYVVFVM